MNVFKFNKILKYESITGRLIAILYDKESKKGILFHKKLDDLIKEHYEVLIENKYPDNLPYILNELYARESMRTFVKDKMIYNLTVASNSEFAIIIRNNYGINWYQYIEENIDELLKKLNCEKIQKIVLVFPKMPENIKRKINEYLIERKEKYIEYLLFGKLKEYVIKEEYNDLLTLVVKLVDEILKHEDKSYFDIRKRQSGYYSDVVEIGSKIIKLGRNRKTYEIPYDKRILIPLVRVDFSKISKLKVTLEVTEKVSSEIKINDEELYLLYREMRDRGIICADMREENIGILLRKNVPNWKGSICDDNATKGIIDEYEDEILDIGSKVILDLDYIYNENAKNINWGNSATRDFEFRYQSEKKEEQKTKTGKVKKILKKDIF